MSEFLKVPFLVEHFQVHKFADASMTFSKFIEIHYGSHYRVFDDYDQDMKLPFKSHDAEVTSVTQFLAPIYSFIDIQPSFIAIHTDVSTQFLFVFTHGVNSQILQPPRNLA